MTGIEQLRILSRQFPRATELAVSRDLYEALLSDVVRQDRYARFEVASPAPATRLGSILVQPLDLMYRATRLTLVEPA